MRVSRGVSTDLNRIRTHRDEALMKTDHLANIATVVHAKTYDVAGGARTSLPYHRGFGHRELSMEPDELCSCLVYQIGVLAGFLKLHGLPLNHVKPHGAIYGRLCFPSLSLVQWLLQRRHFPPRIRAWRLLVQPEPLTGVKFIAEWFADLDYDSAGKLLITKSVICSCSSSRTHQITTNAGGYFPLGENIGEVTICCHLDTLGTVVITTLVKALVDESNERAGYN
ncbi:hypothetical protein B0H11DRAFT_1734717 [Mycena galericulata]|nr:hypothetical protein B0H11DRAFT_1734717 [Mycena galericulata]